MKKGLILGCSIGNCVHVAGVVHFLNLAADEGYETSFLGPAVSVDTILEHVQRLKPDMVALSYRLTPENVVPIINELKEKAKALEVQPRWLFGGTRPVAAKAKEQDFFDTVFDSTEDLDDCIALLRNSGKAAEGISYSDNLIERMESKQPYPLLRHHFGLPSYEDTLRGIEKIADSRVLDIISLGPDQNTQQYFFHPEQRNPDMDGAGGVPIHSKAEFIALKEASQRGNYPLMRCYSGTADVFSFAELLKETINNAWCAVPLSWYNELDGRGTRTLEASMEEAQQLMQWHGMRNIPVEVNEPHHWGLRDAHDTISVVMSFISAYNAKKYGVTDYISQYMFNIPNAMSFSMDLAKVLAQVELTESLSNRNFRVYREVRAGLPFLSSDTDMAKGQLASSTYLSMAVQPHIIHVVGYSEAEHAATPEVVIESVKIVRGVVRSILHGGVSYKNDMNVLRRKEELLSEARFLLNFIQDRYRDYVDDPLSSATVLADCIRQGILDAPHIVKNEKFRGTLQTRIIDGKCVAYDEANQTPLTEAQRLKSLSLKEPEIDVDASKRTINQ